MLYLALRALPSSTVAPLISGPDPGRTVGNVLRVGIGVFVLTGSILTAARLTAPEVGGAYMGLLAIKIIFAFVMFGLAMPRRQRVQSKYTPPPLWRQRRAWIVGIGLIVYLISLSLDELIEASLRDLG